jgi:hypothetical protein
MPKPNFPKDFIFKPYPSDNPCCVLQNGGRKGYNQLHAGDSIFIKEGKKFVPGHITQSRFDHSIKEWVFFVTTRSKTMWRKPSEFKFI